MAWVEKRGDNYLVRWYEPGTRNRRSEKRPTLAEAKILKAELDIRMAKGSYVPITTMTFRRYAEGTISGPDLKQSSKDIYTWILNRLEPVASMPMIHITPDIVREHLNSMTGSATTIGMAHRLLSRVFNQAVNERYLERSPMKLVKPPKQTRREIRPLEPKTIDAIANAIKPRYRAVIYLAAYGGLRIGEIGRLEHSDLDLLNRRVFVRGDTKTAAGRRSVALPAFVCEELARHIERFPFERLVFRTPAFNPIDKDTVFYPLKQACEAIGLEPKPRFHDLRHTMVALAIQQGAHPREIQMRAGHSSIQITMDTYGGLFPGTDTALAEKMDLAYRPSSLGDVRPIREA